MVSEVFIPHRENRWYYIHQLIEHVEEYNCALGCKKATPDEFGPGSGCELLARASLEEPMPEWTDDGVKITCNAREPLTGEPPVLGTEQQIPGQMGLLGDAVDEPVTVTTTLMGEPDER